MIKILNVNIGAYDESKEIIYNFWITGQLKSGFLIKIFDSNRFNLREFINYKNYHALHDNAMNITLVNLNIY